MAARARIGISGWRYAGWRGSFYPEDLPQAQELAYASRRLATIELNGSFYSLQRPERYQAWREQTPGDFVFSIKGGRYITHNLRLREPRMGLANFFASGLLALGPKLGPILWQLPPQLPFNAEVVEAFLGTLPRRMSEAAELALGHDRRLTHPPFVRFDRDRRLRHVMEVRHESFIDAAFIRLLRKYRVALCVSDSDGRWPHIQDVTTDFVYVRLHGHTQLYFSGYSPAALDRWAERVRLWLEGSAPADAPLAAPRLKPPARGGRDVYVYFDNDAKIRAPYDAMNLDARLHGRPRVTFPRQVQQKGRQPYPGPRPWIFRRRSAEKAVP